ncbi:phage portal protein [Candidatus Campbellbacteria bacterium]|nr:MAG: phage portal protein [Candidatus Campbellbacteria bacterium]
MNILEKTLNLVGLTRIKTSSVPFASGITETDPFVLWSKSRKISIEKSMTTYNAWTYSAIRAIAEELAKISFRLFQVNKDGVHEEIFDHELLDLLDGVNPFQTGYELRYLTASHLELAGNSYWLLDGVEKDTDKPKAIFLLNPRYTNPVPAPLPEFIKGYSYSVDGKSTTYKPAQILHIKYPDPNDPYQGIGTVQAISDWIDSDNYASEVNLNYFKNGARLGGLLSSENAITDAQMKVLRASFENLYKGAGNAYRVAVLPKGVKYDEASSNPKDMDFANLQQVMRDKILAGFRVPKTILGGSESETNRATAETSNYIFAARTIKPKMEMIVQQLNEFLVPRYGDNLYLDFVDPVPEDKAQKIEEMKAAVALQPVMSVNEAREEYFGLDGVDNGESVMTDFSKVALGKPKPKSVSRTGRKNTTADKKPSTRGAKNTKARKVMAEEIAKRITENIESSKKQFEEVKTKARRDLSDLSNSEYEVLYKGFVLRVTRYENLQHEAIKKFNSNQKTVVLSNLNRFIEKKSWKITQEDIFNKENWIGVMVDLSKPILSDLYESEGKEAMQLLGSSDFRITPEVRKALDRAIELMAQSYNETTLGLLKDAIEEGLAEGASLPQLESKISNIYAFSDEVRAAQVARTETFRIANDSTKEAWKQTGVVKTIKWYTAADEMVCPWCENMNGKVISIDENFYDKGDVHTGSDGSDLDITYSDVGAPPLHVSCRCYTRPDEISIEG